MSAFFVTAISPQSVHAATLTVPSTEEASVYSAFPTKQDGNMPRIWVGWGSDSGEETAYIKFPSSYNGTTIDPTKVTSAKIKLFLFDENNDHDSTVNPVLKKSHTITAQTVQGTWSESNVTWVSANEGLHESPNYGSSVTTLPAGTARSNWVTIDVTSTLKLAPAPSAGYFTVRLADLQSSTSNVNDLAFAGKGFMDQTGAVSDNYVAQLEVTLADESASPTPSPTPSPTLPSTSGPKLIVNGCVRSNGEPSTNNLLMLSWSNTPNKIQVINVSTDYNMPSDANRWDAAPAQVAKAYFWNKDVRSYNDTSINVFQAGLSGYGYASGKPVPIAAAKYYAYVWDGTTATKAQPVTIPLCTPDPVQPITSVIIRTTFMAEPGQEPTPAYGSPTSPWPRVAVYLNNGYNYTGLYEAGSCTQNGASTNPVMSQPSCGTPNLYREKLLEEFEVSGATFSKDITVPVSNLTVQPTDGGKPLTKLSYAFHNDYKSLTGGDRNVGVLKVEIIDPNTSKVLKTLTPASVDTNTFIYLDTGITDFSGRVDGVTNGMVYVFDASDRALPVIKNGNNWYMVRDSSLNFLMNDLQSLTSCRSRNPGDLNNDNVVNLLDFNIVVSDFGKTGTACFSKADQDGNGKVDLLDFNTVVASFGKKY